MGFGLPGVCLGWLDCLVLRCCTASLSGVMGWCLMVNFGLFVCMG